MSDGRNRLDPIETAAEFEIIAYSSSVEWRKNQLVSAAQYRSALSKNIVDFDTPLVRLADAESRATAAEATVTALREALGVPEWQPIETAPKDGTVVYLWNKKAGVASKNIRWVVEAREGNKHPNCIMDGWKTDDMDAWGCLVPDQFSHWMLPWELPGPTMKGD